MNDSIILELAQNAAILLSFSMLYDMVWLKDHARKGVLAKILTGVVIGGIGIIIMLTPWTLAPGIQFDTRSVVLSISGLFFGALPTSIAMCITLLFRILEGGDGMWAGSSIIVTSGVIGIVWNKLRTKWKERKVFLELLGLGISVHLAMIGCIFLLPPESVELTLKTLSVPLIVVYVPATVFLGNLMVHHHANWLNRRARETLAESERRFKGILNSTNLLSVLLDLNGNITFCNPYLLKITGYDKEELIGRNWFEIFIPETEKEELFDFYGEALQGLTSETNHENEILTKSGDRLMIFWNNTLLSDANGNIIGAASIGINITTQKKIEEQLQQHKVNLEEEVRARTRELLEKNEELEAFNQLFINREYRIKELKERVKSLEAALKTKRGK